MSDVQAWIKETVTTHPVVLFMKGTAQFPQCGFSGRAIELLKSVGVDNLVTVNVLEDDEVRQGIKDFSNWPTIPQLYIKGEFVGGADILNEMHESGELEALIKGLALEAPDRRHYRRIRRTLRRAAAGIAARYRGY